MKEERRTIKLRDCVWNVMAHAQKPDFVFRGKGRVQSNQRGRQFSRLLASEVCASAVVTMDTQSSEVVWRVLATHSIRQFPLHLPSRGSPCAITFQLDSVYEDMQCLLAASYSDLNMHPGRTMLETYLPQRIFWNSSWLSSDSPVEFQDITSIKTWPFTSQLSAIHRNVITPPLDTTYFAIMTASLNKIINILRHIPEANNIQSHCPDTLKSHTI
jgi:hypothetical protein